jgi:hypothetical protein
VFLWVLNHSLFTYSSISFFKLFYSWPNPRAVARILFSVNHRLILAFLFLVYQQVDTKSIIKRKSRSYDNDMRLSGITQVFGRTKVRERLPVVVDMGQRLTP